MEPCPRHHLPPNAPPLQRPSARQCSRLAVTRAWASLPQLALKFRGPVNLPGILSCVAPTANPSPLAGAGLLGRNFLGWTSTFCSAEEPLTLMCQALLGNVWSPRSLWTLQPDGQPKLTGVHSVAQLVFPGSFPAWSQLGSVLRLLQYLCVYGPEPAQTQYGLVPSQPHLLSFLFSPTTLPFLLSLDLFEAAKWLTSATGP